MSQEELKSDRIVDELNNLHSDEQILEVDEEKIKLVVFLVDKHLFAFWGSDVREILPANRITWIPGATEYIPGVINIRGDIETVIALRQVLGIAGEHSQPGFFIMAKTANQSSGILVDDIVDVFDAPASMVSAPLLNLEAKLNYMVVKQLEYDRKVVNILSVSRIFDRVVV